MIVRIEWHGIKMRILGDRYADGDYELGEMFICNDKWVDQGELPAHMITESAEREIYSLVGKAMCEEDFDCDAMGSCVWGHE